jgi:hypothetical protein
MEVGGRKARAALYLIGLALLVAYSVVSISPLRDAVGRREPRIAALFSPPFLNFGATYTSGPVLEFQMGMNRLEIAQVLKEHYVKHSVLRGGCGENVKFVMPDIEIDSAEGAALLMKKDVLCVWDQTKRITLILSMKNDSLSQVRVAAIHSEL